MLLISQQLGMLPLRPPTSRSVHTVTTHTSTGPSSETSSSIGSSSPMQIDDVCSIPCKLANYGRSPLHPNRTGYHSRISWGPELNCLIVAGPWASPACPRLRHDGTRCEGMKSHHSWSAPLAMRTWCAPPSSRITFALTRRFEPNMRPGRVPWRFRTSDVRSENSTLGADLWNRRSLDWERHPAADQQWWRLALGHGIPRGRSSPECSSATLAMMILSPSPGSKVSSTDTFSDRNTRRIAPNVRWRRYLFGYRWSSDRKGGAAATYGGRPPKRYWKALRVARKRIRAGRGSRRRGVVRRDLGFVYSATPAWSTRSAMRRRSSTTSPRLTPSRRNREKSVCVASTPPLLAFMTTSSITSKPSSPMIGPNSKTTSGALPDSPSVLAFRLSTTASGSDRKILWSAKVASKNLSNGATLPFSYHINGNRWPKAFAF